MLTRHSPDARSVRWGADSGKLHKLNMGIPDPTRNVRFGPFEVDRKAGELRKHGTRVRLQEQPFIILCVLLDSPGELVTREVLRQRIWPGDTFVDFERGLNTAVMKLRQALNDPAAHPIYIETVPRHGYRFVAPVQRDIETAEVAPEIAGAVGSGPVVVPERRRSRIPESWILWVGAASVVAGITLAGATALKSTYRTHYAWTITPLTSLTGAEFAPSLSSDGKSLAFSHLSGGNTDIFTISAAGTDLRRITTGLGDETTPRWSPDGRHIAYLADHDEGRRVMLISPDAGQARVLAETRVPHISRFADGWKLLGAQPWTSDGAGLLFSKPAHDGQLSLWRIEVRTGEQRQLTAPPDECDDVQASVSPRNFVVAFARRCGGRGQLYLLQIATGRTELLLADGYNNEHPAWSADAGRIVFESERSGQRNLWEVDVSSHAVSQLTVGPGRDGQPSVGRRGGLVYWHLTSQYEIRRVDLNTGVDSLLISGSGRHLYGRLSLDGTMLAYASSRTGNMDIWIRDLRTARDRRLTADEAMETTPDWAPDGTTIVYLSNRDGAFQPWTVDVATGRSRKLADYTAFTSHPSMRDAASPPRWSPDGTQIGLITSVEGKPVFVAFDPRRRDAEQRISGIRSFDWYQDAGRIIVSRDNGGDAEIAALHLETGRERVLYRGAHTEIACAADGTHISFIHGPSHFAQALSYIELSRPLTPHELPTPTGTPARVTDISGNWHAHNGGWSSDAAALVYTRDTPESDIYGIVNYR